MAVLRSSLIALGLAAAVPACLYDAANRCSAFEHLDVHDTCVCDDGAVVVDYTCAPCPDGEIVVNGACACPVGLVREMETGGCIPTPGQGVACSETEPCPSDAFPRCSADGYCTSDCATATDCVGGYACDLAQADPVCVRPPSGLATPCETQDDCATFEASYCETTVGHACLVPACTLDPDDCFIGWTCCDLSSFGFTTTLCVPEGQCPT